MRDFAEFERALSAVLKVDGSITSDMSVTDAKKLWLKKSIFKKFVDKTNEIEANSGCLALFRKSNEMCRDFALRPHNLFDDEVIGEVKSLFDSFFHQGPTILMDAGKLSDGFGVGPGASIGSESHNFYTKLFDSRITCTSERLYREYRYAISLWPTWVEAENRRESMFGHEIVSGNRLSFVPKTSEISRSICTEPILNMVVQKGIGYFLEEVLRKRFKIDLSKQPILNRKLARLGSLDGSFGTIDLSSASDSMSLHLLREILPASAMRWFELARSPCVVYPDGETEELHMISSMGNAFTFPLQTLLFASIVVASYRILGVKPTFGVDGPQNFAVFGDDIIVRKDSYDFVVRNLKLFGFTVNEAKSFNTGDFRESCGGDFLRGHNIRGVYLKSLSSDADVYSAINRLVRWSAEHDIWLFEAVAVLKKWVKFLPIPPQDGDTEGIKVPRAPLGLARDRNTGAVIYHVLKAKALSFRLPNDEAEQRWYPGTRGKRRKAISYNSAGLLVAFIGGFIRNGRITVRSEQVVTKIRRRMTSSWCYLVTVEKNSPGASWVRCAERLLSE